MTLEEVLELLKRRFTHIGMTCDLNMGSFYSVSMKSKDEITGIGGRNAARVLQIFEFFYPKDSKEFKELETRLMLHSLVQSKQEFGILNALEGEAEMLVKAFFAKSPGQDDLKKLEAALSPLPNEEEPFALPFAHVKSVMARGGFSPAENFSY